MHVGRAVLCTHCKQVAKDEDVNKDKEEEEEEALKDLPGHVGDKEHNGHHCGGGDGGGGGTTVRLHSADASFVVCVDDAPAKLRHSASMRAGRVMRQPLAMRTSTERNRALHRPDMVSMASSRAMFWLPVAQVSVGRA